ncbi:thiol reductant ABC exporter subunit CydD [Ktedonobacteria bacterium brp13]|nr:thiol reductant ABC exporter subunit CydD [Ktedonobacteria bacterium brp13]
MNINKRLLQYVKTMRPYIVVVALLSFLTAIFILLQSHYIALIINGAFLKHESLAYLMSPLLVLLLVIVGRAAVIWGTTAATNFVSTTVKGDMRLRLFRHILKLGPMYIKGERSGEIANTTTDGIEALDAYFIQYFPQVCATAVIPLVLLIVVFAIDPLSGIVLLITFPLLPIFMILIGKQANAMTERRWRQLSTLSAHFLDVLQGMTTLKLFGRTTRQRTTIRQISDRFGDATMSVLRVAFLSALVMELGATISNAIIAVEIGLRLLYGQIPFEQAFFVLLVTPEFYMPLRNLGTQFHNSMESAAGAQRIFDILETTTPHQATAEEGTQQTLQQTPPHTPPHTLPHTPQIVALHDIHYTYPDIDNKELSTASQGRKIAGVMVQAGEDELVTSREGPAPIQSLPRQTDQQSINEAPIAPTQQAALDGVSFELRRGQKIALIGKSGAGKSTIANLLLRFIEPDSGTLTVDGIPIQSFSAQDWRTLVAWQPQRPYLFNTTLADNIRLGHPEASQQEVEEAAKRADLHTFIQTLPRGYETVIGERGTRLSGGQLQRLSLARALLKKAPILVLDEATSTLDAESESQILKTINEIAHERIILIIAHRLNTISNADQILVMQEGQVIASGTHRTLLTQSPIYQELVKAYGEEEASI